MGLLQQGVARQGEWAGMHWQPKRMSVNVFFRGNQIGNQRGLYSGYLLQAAAPETPAERMKRIIAAQLNKQSSTDSMKGLSKRR
eukprot:scaffold144769_cov24-Tisochrysis_lutea.AAC.1